MNKYRTHTLGELNKSHIDSEVRLSGWVHNIRDHGGITFVDLRDNYGITQLVSENLLHGLGAEYVVTISGKVVARTEESINGELKTGEIEVVVSSCEIISTAEPLPFMINNEHECNEDLRLRYRFLDLRRKRLHNNILLRSQVISFLRQQMTESGFTEFQTPILTASSPEGARDYLVPSRIHQGKFYALPQAPQQFKQLLMVAGFDRYFQIAPCFRDEDARADRSPGEFYQLDIEMSFVEENDVFAAIEPVLTATFAKFGNKKIVSNDDGSFPRITYKNTMLQFGTDKPDLRNPLKIEDVSEVFAESEFAIFARAVAAGKVVRAIFVTGISEKPRSFFDKLNDFAISEGAGGLGYIIFTANGEAKGPIAKFLDQVRLTKLCTATDAAIFFICDEESIAAKLAGKVRTKLAEELNLIKQDEFRFCWITDFPFFERNPDSGKLEFSHNPFSMPNGGMKALDEPDPLAITAQQYDIVCNGIELSSGAIRNHDPEIMYKAFQMAGYSNDEVDQRFGGMISAFKFGAPPHGGLAPGIDRMVMLLANEPNIREIIAFPMNGKAEDLMMKAPSSVSASQLKELGITKLGKLS